MLSIAEQLTREFRVFERRVKRSGHDCTKCGTRHYEARYTWCSTCRALSSEYKKEYRRDHKLRGLCITCPQPHDSSVRCTKHREYHNAWVSNYYHQKRADGLCGAFGCQRESEMYFCPEHAERQAGYRRARKGRARWS